MSLMGLEPHPNIPPLWVNHLTLGILLPIYAWRAYTNPTTSITSTYKAPKALSTITTSVIAIVWYHDVLPGENPIHRTWDYGNVRPYTFRLPDGTTRVNNSPMLANTYNTLIARLADSDTYPTDGF